MKLATSLIGIIMHWHAYLGLSDALSTCSGSEPTVIHDFPAGTWIENLVVRNNGQIIATEDSKPRVHLVDPSSHNATILHEFTETASITGIAEGACDVFYVCSANYSSKLLQGYGEGFVYKIDLRSFSQHEPSSVKVSKIASVPEAGALNGLIMLPDQRHLLSTDFLKGVIWKIDVRTGESTIAINNTYTQSTAFGANGIKYLGGHLYFTNSQQETLVKAPITDDGNIIGGFRVVTKGGFVPDDFALDLEGNAYIATFTSKIAHATDGKDGILRVSPGGHYVDYIADIAGPTACALGRTQGEENTLYVSTTGGDNAYLTGKPVTVSGKIFKLRL